MGFFKKLINSLVRNCEAKVHTVLRKMNPIVFAFFKYLQVAKAILHPRGSARDC